MSELAKLLAELSTTPLSTILVVAGIFFLFLAVVGKVGAKIVVSAQRQRYAAIIGAILIVLGLGLMIVPTNDVSTKVAEEITTPADRQTQKTANEIDSESPKSEEPPQTATKSVPKDQLDQSLTETEPSNGEIIAQGREAWLTGDYSSALRHFDEIAAAEPDTDAGRLAKGRTRWLRPYIGRILFADDFEDPSVASGARWRTHPGAPPIGGEFIVERDDVGSVLQGEKHYHAAPRIRMEEAIDAFEIKLRLRPKTAGGGGTHINIMMHPTEGRTTLGLYFEEGIVSIWENKNDEEIGERAQTLDADSTDWHDVHVVVANRVVEVRISEGPPIRYESPRARPISLTNFNLEVLSSSVQFDDILIVSR